MAVNMHMHMLLFGEGVFPKSTILATIPIIGAYTTDRHPTLYLNARAEDIGGEELERQEALSGQLVELDRVVNLRGRHDQVDHLKVLLQAVPDKDDALVDQRAQANVGRLERDCEGRGVSE